MGCGDNRDVFCTKNSNEARKAGHTQRVWASQLAWGTAGAPHVTDLGETPAQLGGGDGMSGRPCLVPSSARPQVPRGTGKTLGPWSERTRAWVKVLLEGSERSRPRGPSAASFQANLLQRRKRASSRSMSVPLEEQRPSGPGQPSN